MSFRFAAVLVLSIGFAACGGGGYGSPSSPSPSTNPNPGPAGSTTVTIPGGAATQTTAAFGANPLTISTGTTISWLNDDNTAHTTTGDANQWSSGSVAPGGRFNFTFTSAGRYTYHCQIHPNMVGTIVVQ